MKTLIVGAGAVGQCYGRHLGLGGAEVFWYVKPKHAEECRRGFDFYPLNEDLSRSEPVHLAIAPERVLTSLDEVRDAGPWDQVYFCMSSAGLRGEWIDGFLAAMGSASTLVSLQPGPEDRNYILSRGFPPERLVVGMITLIAYPAPLPGESFPRPGTAYWFPPLAPAPFSGPAERVRPVVDALKRGGLPCKTARDVPAMVALPNILLTTFLTELEADQWSLRALLNGESLARIRRATREGVRLVANGLPASARALLLVFRPLPLRLILLLSEKVVPFNLETYLKAHFTKVGEQTRLFMRQLLSEGSARGRSTPELAKLEERLRARSQARS